MRDGFSSVIGDIGVVVPALRATGPTVRIHRARSLAGHNPTPCDDQHCKASLTRCSHANTLEDGLLDTVERVRGWCDTGIASSPPGGPSGQTHGTSPTERAALAYEDKFRRDLDAAERHLIEATEALQRLTSFMNRMRELSVPETQHTCRTNVTLDESVQKPTTPTDTGALASRPRVHSPALPISGY